MTKAKAKLKGKSPVKGQQKISLFFGKAVPEKKNENSSKSIDFKHDIKGINSDSDSDLEVIESTPQNKAVKSIFQNGNNLSDDDFIPPTPISEKVHSKSFVNLIDQNKNKSKFFQGTAKKNMSLNLPSKSGKLNLGNLSKSNLKNNFKATSKANNKGFKRSAESNTGHSPLSKRPENFPFKENISEATCKSNLLDKFDNDDLYSNSENKSFSVISPSKQEIKPNNLETSLSCKTNNTGDSFSLEFKNDSFSLLSSTETTPLIKEIKDNVYIEIHKDSNLNVNSTDKEKSLETHKASNLVEINCKSDNFIDTNNKSDKLFGTTANSDNLEETTNKSNNLIEDAITKSENSTEIIKNDSSTYIIVNDKENTNKKTVEEISNNVEHEYYDKAESIPMQGSQSFECLLHNDVDSINMHVDEEKCAENNQSSKKDEVVETINDSFDDMLTFDFDKMSPFKMEKSIPIEIKKPHIRKINKLLENGLGKLSYAITGNFGRYVVTEVICEVIGELFLHLQSIENGAKKTCVLRGFWSQSIIEEGNVVHILSASETDGCFQIDSKKGIIVINPDYLISGTSVVAGVFCRRKAVLNERFRGMDSGNKIMLIGSIVHQLFQEVVKNEIKSKKELDQLVSKLMSQTYVLKDLYKLGITETVIHEEMQKFLPHIHQWSNRYLGKYNNTQSVSSKPNQWNGLITDIEDIEENIWSPRLGLKGKVDMTVKTRLNGKTKVMPLELKTGKPSYSAEHKGQITLYSMMSCDRREDPKGGLLLYLRTGSMEEVPSTEIEKQALIQLRNEMVYYLSAKPFLDQDDNSHRLPPLPEPLNDKRLCEKCPQLLSCSLYQKAIENNVPTEKHAMAELVPNTIGHLTDVHFEYFRHWCLLISLETSENCKTSAISGLWCQDPRKREEAGDCITKLKLETSQKITETESGYYHHVFTRDLPPPDDDLKLIGFDVGESIVLSTAKEIALSQGIITDIQTKSITIVLDRNLSLYFDWRIKVFRIDRLEYQSSMSIVFTNLAQLMSNNPVAANLRSLIIDKKLPEFSKGLDLNIVQQCKPILKALNKTQKKAALKTLMANDYVLLKGFPGAGKTSTIAALVRAMVVLGKTVLLTSYTHSAVDNILLKLKDDNVDFIRLGRISRIHKDIRPFAEELLIKQYKELEKLNEFYCTKKVVATTCLGVNHPIFLKMKFDYCIIDEAAQVLQPVAIGPLFCAEKFILVGDPNQLPPVVKSKQARELGMVDSLFSHLDNPEYTVNLSIQYRMNDVIMSLSNSLIYEGLLASANDQVAKGTLDLPNYKILSNDSDVPRWILELLEPSLENSCRFMDTCGQVEESRDGADMIVNYQEATVLVVLIQYMIRMGLSPEEIGVITPYRAQVKLLKGLINRQIDNSDKVEVNTVDQYQGRDKEAILYSCVRCGIKDENSGEILHDERRLNVAITRAKHKLLIIGDSESLKVYKPFKKLLDILREKQFYKLNINKDDFEWPDNMLTLTQLQHVSPIKGLKRL